jgi:tetratricopeptide (TPR) repeat protein
VVDHRSSLAGVLQELGEFERARSLLEQALKSTLQDLGENHPSVAVLRFNLGLVREDESAWQDAEDYYRLALGSYKLTLGPSHLYAAYARSRLARVLVQLGRPDEAAKEARLAREIAATQPRGSRYRRLIEKALNGIFDPPPDHD